MKRIMQAVVLAALVCGAQAASSESAIPADGESGVFLHAGSSYAVGHPGGRDAVGSAIPADGESGVFQAAGWTAERSAKDERAGSAIPADGESGVFQTAAVSK